MIKANRIRDTKGGIIIPKEEFKGLWSFKNASRGKNRKAFISLYA